MSRKARSRALLRNLRKQARRGNLSALERKQLLQQEKRFRKGRGGFRKGLGAGLGAGLGIAAARYLTSPAFKTLLESRPSLEELMGRLKKEGVPENKVEEVANTVKDADKDATPAEIVQKVEEKVDPAAESTASEDAAPVEERGQTASLLDSLGAMEGPAPARGVGEPAMDRNIFDNDPLDPVGSRLQSDLDGVVQNAEQMTPALFDEREAVFADPEGMGATQERRNLTGELLDELGQFDEDRVVMGEVAPLRRMDAGVIDQDNPYMDQGGLRGPDPAIEQRMAAVRESMRLRDNERSSENMRERAETLERLRREGGFDPFTGEYVDSDRQQRIDAEFDEDFERSAFTDAERAAERENARLDAMDEAAALDAALGRLPVPNEGDLEFGEMEELGQRPALTTPNNALSRRVNVNDPGLRLPIADIQEDPENFFDPQEEAELLRFRNRGRALPGGFGDVQDRLSDFGEPLLVPGRPSQVLDNRAPRGLALSSEQLLADQARRARQSRRRGSRSGIPYRQEMGGKNPKMADLMKKVKAKYGIR